MLEGGEGEGGQLVGEPGLWGSLGGKECKNDSP